MYPGNLLLFSLGFGRQKLVCVRFMLACSDEAYTTKKCTELLEDHCFHYLSFTVANVLVSAAWLQQLCMLYGGPLKDSVPAFCT